MKLLKLIAVNFKGILRDKGYLFMALVVFPILFPLFMFLLISQVSAQKVTSVNKPSVISKSGDVIGVYSSSNPSTEKFRDLLLSKYDHRSIPVDSDAKAIQKVKRLEASYGYKVSESPSGQVNITLWVDKKRNTDMTVFIREIEETVSTFRVINRRKVGEANGVSAEVIRSLQDPVHSKTVNVNESSATVIKFIVLFLMYLCLYGPIMSSNRYSFYSIVSEHEKHWSYIPLLGKMPISHWVASKVGLAVILSSVLSIFGLLVFKGVFMVIEGLESFLLDHGFQSVIGTESIEFLTGLNGSLGLYGYFSFWIISLIGLMQFACITAAIASLFNNQKTASFADSAIGTILLLVILNMNPEVVPQTWNYLVFPFSTGQMLSDVLNESVSGSNLLLYAIGGLVVSMLSLLLAGKSYRKQIGSQTAFT